MLGAQAGQPQSEGEMTSLLLNQEVTWGLGVYSAHLTPLHLKQVGELTLESWQQVGWFCPSPAAAHRRADTVPHRGNTIVLALVKGMQVSQP